MNNILGFLLFLCIFSCSKPNPKNGSSKEIDTLFNFAKATFSWADSNMFAYYKTNNLLTKKAITIYPEKFSFKLFSWGDGQSYTPFVIEVRDSNNQVLDHFSFGDEDYLMGVNDTLDEIFDDNRVLKSVSIDKERAARGLVYNVPKININNELEQLIKTLGIQNDRQKIHQVIEVLFENLLMMRNISAYPDERIVLRRDALMRVNTHHYLDSTIAELSSMQETFGLGRGNTVFFKAKEGVHGYWRLKIIEAKPDEFHVEATFYGSQFYYGIYI